MVRCRSVFVALALGVAAQPCAATDRVGAQPPPKAQIKVVQLTVVRPGEKMVPPKGSVDVLIMKTKGADGQETWRPMSFVGGKMMEHAPATQMAPETVVRLNVTRGDQVQWQSNVVFSVAEIKVHAGGLKQFPTKGNPPSQPFEAALFKSQGGPDVPVRSGPASLNNNNAYYQLYKVSFTMTIDGEKVLIDPDVYCEWETGGDD